jgi:hypothetical protein
MAVLSHAHWLSDREAYGTTETAAAYRDGHFEAI